MSPLNPPEFSHKHALYCCLCSIPFPRHHNVPRISNVTRRKNIPSDTFKIRHQHTQSFIKTGIHLSDHTQSSSLFSLAVTMLKPPHSHQITQRLYTIQPCDYTQEKKSSFIHLSIAQAGCQHAGEILILP